MRWKFRALTFVARHLNLWLPRPVVLLGFSVVLTACVGELREYRGQPYAGKEYPDGYDLHINRPSLSFDGRYMVFDFFNLEEGGVRSQYHLGVYDFETQTVEIIRPKDTRLEWFAASYSPDGNFLVLIQFCWRPDCPPEALGHNIAMLYLPDRRVRMLTDGRKKVLNFDPSWLGESSRPEFVETFIIPKSPIIVDEPGDAAVYYLGGNRHWSVPDTSTPDTSVPFASAEAGAEWFRYTLRRIDLETGNDEMALTRQSGILTIEETLPLSVAYLGRGKIAFNGGSAAQGPKTATFQRADVTGFIYDRPADDVTAIVPNALSSASAKTFRMHSLTGSPTTGAVAFFDWGSHPVDELPPGSRHRAQVVFLWRDGEVTELFNIWGKRKVPSLHSIAMSGDGAYVVALAKSDFETVWRKHMSGPVEEFPLRSVLLAEIRRGLATIDPAAAEE